MQTLLCYLGKEAFKFLSKKTPWLKIHEVIINLSKRLKLQGYFIQESTDLEPLLCLQSLIHLQGFLKIFIF